MIARRSLLPTINWSKKMKSKQLEGRYKCLTLFLLCFVMYMIVYMTKNMFTSAMATIVEEGVMTKTQTGAISAAFWVAYAFFQVVGGFAADKFPPSLLICVGIGGGAVANLVIYLNHSYTVIIITWICNAIIQFGLWPAVFRILATQLSPKYRDKAIFWILFAGTAGNTLSMLIASLVSRWQNNFLLSFIFLVLTLLVWIAVYYPLERRMTVQDECVCVEVEKKSVEIKSISVRTLLISSGLFVILIIGFLRGATSSALTMTTPTMLMESYEQLPAAIATRLSIILVLFSVVGVFISGVVQKRITDNEMKAAPLLMTVCIPPLAVACFIGRIHYIWILACLSVAMVFVQSASLFTNTTIAKRFIAYGKSGTVSGIVNAALAASNAVASFVFPAMAETLSWNIIVVTWLMMLVSATLLSLCVLRIWTRFINS